MTDDEAERLENFAGEITPSSWDTYINFEFNKGESQLWTQ